ncbi:unnamed protein product [Schistocephalus solidus]|uniref:DDE-1 domain-containing protein n=1 Tax=Schistocephalus solidus TaxID=70667 RepID=A0A183SGW3_SCHSO|nr:unnamed protein product [Schistocephalus solidus]
MDGCSLSAEEVTGCTLQRRCHSPQALKAFLIAQQNEKRVRWEVKHKRGILDAERKTELARIDAKAETAVDFGNHADDVKSLERTTCVTKYLKEYTVKDEALEGSGRWIQNCGGGALTENDDTIDG